MTDVLRGMWQRGQVLDLQCHQIAPAQDGTCRLGAWARSDGQTLELGQSHPGQHSLFYAEHGGYVHFDESLVRLRRRLKGFNAKTKALCVDAGETVRFGARSGSVRTPLPLPAIRRDLTLSRAVDLWWDAFIRATEEMYQHHGGGPVTLAASGGTDSLMVMAALKTIGADVVAMSAGHSAENFDPLWASVAADHWGVPFQLVRLPTREADQERLMSETLAVTGDVGCFSNTLMAMSCTLLQRQSGAQGRRVVYTGYHADILVGNKMNAVGAFKAVPDSQRTDEHWRNSRARFATGMIPNTHQLHANFSVDGFGWRAPFGHPEVFDLALSLPLSVSPAYHGRKVFFEAALNTLLPVGKRPWDVNRKVPFNIGSGLFGSRKSQREGGVLTDAGIRRILNEVRQREHF